MYMLLEICWLGLPWWRTLAIPPVAIVNVNHAQVTCLSRCLQLSRLGLSLSTDSSGMVSLERRSSSATVDRGPRAGLRLLVDSRLRNPSRLLDWSGKSSRSSDLGVR